MDSSKFGADPGLPQEIEYPKPDAVPDFNKNSNVAYRCKKCRRVVALQENIVDHVPGEGMTAFQWHKRRSGNSFDKPDEFGCSSIFVEPLKWMKAGNFLTSYYFFLGEKSVQEYIMLLQDRRHLLMG